MNECGCRKGSQNMDQLKNMEEKSLGRASCQSCKCWTIFYFPFYFIFSLFSSFISILFRVRAECDVTCHMSHVTVTRSCDTEKVIEDSGTDNII